MAVIQAGAFHRRNFDSQNFEQLTVTATVGGIALSSAVYGTSRYAEISIESADIRFTTNGTPPTASVGHLCGPTDIIRLDSNEDIATFRAIRAGAADAIIQVTYQELKLTS
jgi:hypothetical protein